MKLINDGKQPLKVVYTKYIKSVVSVERRELVKKQSNLLKSNFIQRPLIKVTERNKQKSEANGWVGLRKIYYFNGCRSRYVYNYEWYIKQG